MISLNDSRKLKLYNHCHHMGLMRDQINTTMGHLFLFLHMADRVLMEAQYQEFLVVKL